jgi:O-antigen/teichoic acid export membrane protein
LSIVVCRGFSVLAASAVAILSARQLGPSGRGALVLLLTVAPFTAAVCSFGINLSGRVQMVAANDPIPLQEYLGLTAVLAIVEAVVCAATGAALLPLAGVRLPFDELALFGLYGATALVQVLTSDALNTFGYTVLAAQVELSGFLVQAGLILGLVVVGSHRFQLFALAIMVSGFVAIGITLASLHRRGGSISARYHRGHWERLIRTGWPSIPSGLSQLLTFRVDRYIVGLFMSTTAVGIYSVSATVPEFLRILSLALGQSAIYRVASGKATPADFRRPLLACVGATMACGFAIWVLSPLAVRILFGPAFAGAVTPLRILLLAEVAMTVFNVDGAVLAGLGRLRDGAVAAMAGFVVVLVADIILIKQDGLVGAAWASVIAYSFMSLIVHLYVRKRTSTDSIAFAPTQLG